MAELSFSEAKSWEGINVENNMIPTKNSMVTIREEMEDDGKYVLFNADNELILVINQTGKFILDRSDGSKTIGEIIDDITDQFSIPENADIQSVVTDYFKRLSLAKLIVLNS